MKVIKNTQCSSYKKKKILITSLERRQLRLKKPDSILKLILLRSC